MFYHLLAKNVPGGIEKIVVSAGRLEFVPGGPAQRGYIPD